MENVQNKGKNKNDSIYTSGKISDHLLRVGVPTVFVNLLFIAYPFYNIFIAGRMLGALSISVITLSFPLQSLLIMVSSAFGVGGGALTAFFWGAAKRKESICYAANTAFITIIISFLLSVVLFLFIPEIMEFLNVPKEIQRCTHIYLKISIMTSFITGCFLTIAAILRSIGDARTPLFLVSGSFLLNAIFLPFIIRKYSNDWETGILALAFTNIGSQLITGLLWIGLSYKKIIGLKTVLKDMKFDKRISYKIISISLPTILRGITLSACTFAITRLAGTFGAAVIAALGVGAIIIDLTMIPLSALGACLSAIIGQNLGIRSERRVHDALISAVWLITPIVVLMAIFIPFFSDSIMRMFTKETMTISIGSVYIRIIGIASLFYGFVVISDSMLVALGKTKTMLICTIIAIFGARIPSAFILSQTSLKQNGIWLSYVIGGLITMFIGYYYLLRLKGQYTTDAENRLE